MGNQYTKQESIMTDCFIIDRILDSNCEYLKGSDEKNIKIGIMTKPSSEDKDNPLALQGIRIGDDQIRRLKNFVKNNNSLTYEFENNVKLNLFRKDNNAYYNLKKENLDITKSIDPLLVKHYKTIGLCSNEFDEIPKFYK